MHNGEYAFITLDFEEEDNWKFQEWYLGPKTLEGILNIGVKNGQDMLSQEEFSEFAQKLFIKFHELQIDVNKNNLTVGLFNSIYIYF